MEPAFSVRLLSGGDVIRTEKPAQAIPRELSLGAGALKVPLGGGPSDLGRSPAARVPVDVVRADHAVARTFGQG